MSGKGDIRFIELVRDTVQNHGIRWAVQYYSKRMPVWEVRFWLKLAII